MRSDMKCLARAICRTQYRTGPKTSWSQARVNSLLPVAFVALASRCAPSLGAVFRSASGREPVNCSVGSVEMRDGCHFLPRTSPACCRSFPIAFSFLFSDASMFLQTYGCHFWAWRDIRHRTQRKKNNGNKVRTP